MKCYSFLKVSSFSRNEFNSEFVNLLNKFFNLIIYKFNILWDKL